jgi:hypothetical protein
MSSIHSYHDDATSLAVAAGYSPEDAWQRPDDEPFGDILNALDPGLTALGFGPAIIGSTSATFTRPDGATLRIAYTPPGASPPDGGTLDGHGNAGLPHLGGGDDRGCNCRDDRPNSARPQPSPSVFDDCGQPMPSFSGSQDDFPIQPDNRHFGPDRLDPED